MSSTSNFCSTPFFLQSQSKSHNCNTLFFLHRKSPHIGQYRVRRRRRLKTNRRYAVRNQLGPSSFDNFVQNLGFQLPSLNSLDLIAPALGFASAAALYLSRLKSGKNSEVSDIGEWILFTSPTPFNRFVLLRCPSILFEGSELLEDVNEKLVKEDRHFVRLNSGRIQVKDVNVGSGSDRENELVEKLVYQRVCVGTEDGGVISLDWPATLDLKEEHGLDTTILLVAGTAEGSLDWSIKSFVCECLKRGCFPIVMNPRGCAGSPLTTARLFTAADSDDIFTAIQFINKARPWTTLMGVGWGYSANMLTKYLGEVGENTPLTAAICIDNPFDLEEVTRSSSYEVAFNQKLTGGLRDILRSNKELFQGRTKGFDVEKALLSHSVRDFEKAISMVSYGFDAIEDFYSESSTRGAVGNVKIPVLFIQNDDGTVPLFSIPRGLIAENPYTSLLLCSCPPSSAIAGGRSVISWCQHITIEWLAAVELGLLKGRHPLLQDVDVTINPSKGLALVEGRPPTRVKKVDKLRDLTQSSALNGYSGDPINEMRAKDDTAASIQSSTQDSWRNLALEDDGLQQVDNGALQQKDSIDSELLKADEVSPVDEERGQVLQTAEVVMNMLDVTMPDTLSEKQKEKVLTAVGQGETLMTALQGAVPEDVRGKLTTVVTGIMQSHGTNINFDGLLHIGKGQNVSSESKSNINEEVGGLSTEESLHKDPSSGQENRADDQGDGSGNNHPAMDQAAEGPESELPTSERSEKIGLDQSQYSDPNQNGPETNAKEDQSKVDQDGGMGQLEIKEEKNIRKIEEKTLDSTDQNQITSSTNTEESPSSQASSSDAQLQGDDNQKREDKNMEPVLDQNKSVPSDSNPPTFSVSEALDALTGMDDSTQVAINSVFGVIENMITHLEEEHDNENEPKDMNEVKENKTDSASEEMNEHKLKKNRNNRNEPSPQPDVLHDSPSSDTPENHMGSHVEEEHDNENEPKDMNEVKEKKTDSASEEMNEHKLKKNRNNRNEPSPQPDVLHDRPASDTPENHMGSHVEARNGVAEEKPTQNFIPFNENGIDCSQGNNTVNLVGKNQDETEEHLVGSKHLVETSNTLAHVNNIPLYIYTNPYGNAFYNGYFQRHPLSKIPNTESLDIDTTTTLLLDYIPEEGQWKLLEQPSTAGDSNDDTAIGKGVERKFHAHSPAIANDTDNVIEPPYVILDTEKQQQKPIQESKMVKKMNENVEIEDNGSEKLMQMVKNVVLNSLKVEVSRRLSAVDMKEMESDLARDMEQVANAVSLAVQNDIERAGHFKIKDKSVGDASEKIDALQGKHIIKAISFSVHDTTYLRKVLPFGVIVGSILAALRKLYTVAPMSDSVQSNEDLTLDQVINSCQVGEAESNRIPLDKTGPNLCLDRSSDWEQAVSNNLKNDTVMVGAVTAAFGVSALLADQQNSGTSSKAFDHQRGSDKLEEGIGEKDQNNIVTSLAEKAMSVAGPVVPTKEDGEVDQERLVAMLTDLGQKGGMLRLVGKLALLWGGIRGAMSLTNKLISFLRIADRPLFQRILAFVGMVVVLWSPVVVPLLPTLVQSWATQTSYRFAELACIAGLYIAVMILVMLWGKRIRGYDNPLEQYGLDFASSMKVQNFLKAFIGGAVLVLLIQSVNSVLGCASLSWPSSLPSYSFDSMAWLKACGKMTMLVGQGIVTATTVALVEELLFRSWLPDEIATDLGYHRGIILSGLAFSLIQRSPQAIPGLWLLSLGLAGAKQRSQGSLSIPIGLRAGIMSVSFILQMGGFLTYRPNLPLWVTGNAPFQPFSGIVGLAFGLLVAAVFHPRQPLLSKRITRTIRE